MAQEPVAGATVEQSQIAQILTVARLGDVDHKGWWQSHGLDETGSFLLGRSFKRTWAATAMELSMISARARHDENLRRQDAVHLFSDELPFFRIVHSWLLEQKLEDDLSPFAPYRSATTDALIARLPISGEVERRASGLYLGTVSRSDLDASERVSSLLDRLLGAYRTLDTEFRAPYVDLTA